MDILERLNVLFSNSGYVLNSSIDGCIQMKSYLAGNPELRLALNEDLVIGKVRFFSYRISDAFSLERIALLHFTNAALMFRFLYLLCCLNREIQQIMEQ